MATAVGTLCRRSKRAAEHATPSITGANLPAGLIAEAVLADDVVGYLRFRTVCGAWRRCAEPPRAHGGSLDSRFHPRRWIMLPKVFAGRVDRGAHLRGPPTAPGPVRDRAHLVLLCQKGTGDMHLLNPLTQQLAALPNASSLLRSPDNSSCTNWLNRLEKLRVLGAGLADSSTVALHLDDHEIELVVAKPDDELCTGKAAPEPVRDWAHLRWPPHPVVHLLNPITRQLTALPNAASLLSSQDHNTWLSRLDKLQVLSAGLADSSTLALHLNDREIELAVAKPGDEQWSLRARPKPGPYWDMDSADSIVSTLSFANRFYCVSRKGIKAVGAAAGRQPQLAVAVEEAGGARENYLVDNDGELIRVRRAPAGTKTTRYHVHRVDLGAGKMVRIYDLRGRAVFVCGDGRSVSVHGGLSSSIKADTVYWCRCSSDERPTIAAYHFKNGWTTRDLHSRPGSILDYLSRYVCLSEDTVVPAPLLRCRCVRAVPAAAGPWKRKGKRKRKANSKMIGSEWVN
ncbi:hypothetical protein ACQ4PT_042294 [Festuca glaucescens]